MSNINIRKIQIKASLGHLTDTSNQLARCIQIINCFTQISVEKKVEIMDMSNYLKTLASKLKKEALLKLEIEFGGKK